MEPVSRHLCCQQLVSNLGQDYAVALDIPLLLIEVHHVDGEFVVFVSLLQTVFTHYMELPHQSETRLCQCLIQATGVLEIRSDGEICIVLDESPVAIGSQ